MYIFYTYIYRYQSCQGLVNYSKNISSHSLDRGSIWILELQSLWWGQNLRQRSAAFDLCSPKIWITFLASWFHHVSSLHVSIPSDCSLVATRARGNKYCKCKRQMCIITSINTSRGNIQACSYVHTSVDSIHVFNLHRYIHIV